MSSLKTEFYNSLSDFFKSQGLTQEEIAVRLGVSQAHINQLLNGKSAFGKRTAQRWSEEFGLSAAWLLTGEGEMLTTNITQNNKNGDNYNGEQVVLKNSDTHDFIEMIKKKDVQIDRAFTVIEGQRLLTEQTINLLGKRDEQLDRLITLLEKDR